MNRRSLTAAWALFGPTAPPSRLLHEKQRRKDLHFVELGLELLERLWLRALQNQVTQLVRGGVLVNGRRQISNRFL